MAARNGRKRPQAARADMHVSGESDGPVVPAKRANKAGPIGGGVRGGKGTDQGKRLHRRPWTGHRAGERVDSDWKAYDKRHEGIGKRGSPPCCITSRRNCCRRATTL